MENLIKNKVKMKQSTVWKVSKVLSMVPDVEKVLSKGEQLLLLGSGYTPICSQDCRSEFPHLTREDAIPVWQITTTKRWKPGLAPSFKKHLGGAVPGQVLS